MATIQPFHGVRYQVPDLSSVISQPYDRVRYGLQEKYYALHPHNVVRIIRGIESPMDAPDRLEGPNVYTRARAYYDLWQVEGVLAREDRPAFYVYHQTFTIDGHTKTRKGLISAFESSAFDEGSVLPHERTHAGPKVDRLRLLRALEANMGLIFMLYPDPQNRINALLDVAIAGREPDADVVEMYESDVRQRLWAVTDEKAIRVVQEEMAPKRNLIIADGHHRYETALNYRDEMRATHPGALANAAFNYRMVSLVSMDDPGLVILPTHREVLDYPQIGVAEVLARAATSFSITRAADMHTCLAEMKAQQTRHAFGLYGEGQYHVLVLRNPDLIDEWIAEDRSLTWKSLDVSIAHQILLKRIVGMSAEDAEGQHHIRYHRDPLLAVQNVDAGRGNLVLFLNPTRIDQVKVCAEQGEKMPQKSTDFYPKMVTGLTMMSVGREERI